MHSDESLDIKLLSTITQIESDKKLKNDLEAVSLFVFPSGLVASSKDTSENTGAGTISVTKVGASSVGGRDMSTGFDPRFHKRSECYYFSKTTKEFLCR